jgi:hypothetical protein
VFLRRPGRAARDPPRPRPALDPFAHANLAERSFDEERRRTKVIPRLMDEKAAMKLATMIRAAERWCRVSVSDLEGHQLRLLRAELGLDPPPATEKRKIDRRKSVAA